MQIKTNIVSCHTTDSKPVKQEVNSTVVLPPLVFPDSSFSQSVSMRDYYINVIILSVVKRIVVILDVIASHEKLQFLPSWGQSCKTFYGRNLRRVFAPGEPF